MSANNKEKTKGPVRNHRPLIISLATIVYVFWVSYLTYRVATSWVAASNSGALMHSTIFKEVIGIPQFYATLNTCIYIAIVIMSLIVWLVPVGFLAWCYRMLARRADPPEWNRKRGFLTRAFRLVLALYGTVFFISATLNATVVLLIAFTEIHSYPEAVAFLRSNQFLIECLLPTVVTGGFCMLYIPGLVYWLHLCRYILYWPYQ